MRGFAVTHFVPRHGNVTQIRPTLDLAAWEELERSYVIGRNIKRACLEAERDSFDE